MIRTPDSVLEEAVRLNSELRRGSDMLYKSKLKAERARDTAKAVEAAAFLESTGTVAERQAKATLAAKEARDAMHISEAELERVKSKIRALEQTQSLLQTELRYMRDAGA